MLAWLPAKHDTELSNMKGQSSTWFFFEQLYISTIAVNVTIMLTSSFGSGAGSSVGSSASPPGLSREPAGAAEATATGAAGGNPAAASGWASQGLSKQGLTQVPGAVLTEVQRLVVRGMFSGQLINVSDVGLTLGSLDLQNRLLNQVGLRSVLIRHYTWRCVAQARKVLGGAGPGVAQIPTSILWAGASVFDMVREMVDGTLPLPMILPALLHVVFTFGSQMLGITSRLAMALLELVPVDRRGALSDRAALQRYVQMPETVVDAFYQAVVELYWGTAAGFAGLVLDPAAGLRQPGALGVAGAIVGLIKGGAGLLLRPVFGVVDATSKSLRGVGLVFLGRRGWHGKVVRRVRPPGALEGPAAASAAPGSGFAQRPWQAERDLHVALIASWQARLSGLHPRLAGDEVMEVLATRSRRLLLLTRQHVLYLRAKVATRGTDAGSCTYTLRWLLECERVDHVRGMEDALKIFLEFHMLLKAPDFSNWRPRNFGRPKKQQQGPSQAEGAAAEAADGGRPALQQGQEEAEGRPAGVGGASKPPEDARAVLLRVPLHHSLRCASPELYQRVIRAVSRHLVQAAAATAAVAAAPRGQRAASAQTSAAVAGTGAAGAVLVDPIAAAEAVLGDDALVATSRAHINAGSYAELYSAL
jgi:hypothetical protein